MNYSVFRFTLNMHNHRSQASVSAFCGDTAIRLCITIADGSNIYEIGEGCVAILSGTKADGTKLWNRCAIENNTIIYDFTEQTATCVGITRCELTLYGADGLVITAPKFIIVVDEREAPEHVENISENEHTAMDLVMSAAAIILKNGGVAGIIVDSEFSDTSENPVQNKVIAEALQGIISRIETLEKGEVIEPDEPEQPVEPEIKCIYYGVGTVEGEAITSEFIMSLTSVEQDSRTTSFAVVPANQYIYFVAPKSYCVDGAGNDIAVFTSGQISQIQGGFLSHQEITIGDVVYYIYRSKYLLDYNFIINVT